MRCKGASNAKCRWILDKVCILNFAICINKISQWPLQRNPRADSRTSSPRRRRSVISMASAACSRIAGTTSTISRSPPRSRRSAILLWHRRLPSRAELGDLQSQLAAGAAAARADHPADAQPAAGGRDGCAAHDHVGAGALRCGCWTDASPQAQYRKAVRLTAQVGTIVATWGRLQAGGGPHCARSGDGPRGELPLHAHRRAAERARRFARSTSR